ncbi:MAG: ATP-binding cassette domain-containing protein [Lachnospiraceae bacterium]|nr:ATP-binding cassette domain-containing protein [Lachnospiraceae bacterium]
MGWFEEQIRERIDRDNDLFSESMENIIGTIEGRRNTGFSFNRDVKEVDAVNYILNYFGVKSVELKGKFADFDEKMEFLLRPHGIMRRKVLLKKGWYKDAFGPMLLFLKEEGKAVAALPGNISGYYYIDDKTGKNVKVGSRNEGLFEEDAIVFYRAFPLKKLTMKDIIYFIFTSLTPGDYLIYGIFSLLLVLVGLISPVLTKILFSDIIISGSWSALLGILIFMVSIAIGNLLIDLMKHFSLYRINTKVSVAVDAAGMMRILSSPVSLFREYSSGELYTRLSHLSTVTTAMIQMIFSAGFTSLLSITYIFQIFNYAKSLVIPSVLIVVINGLVMLLVSYLQSKRVIEYELPAKESGVIFDIINGIQKVKLAGAEKRTFAVWARSFVKSANAIYNKPLILRAYSVLTTAVTVIGTICIYYEAVVNKVTISDYMAFNAAFGYVSAAINGLIALLGSISAIKPLYDMIKPILKTVPEISEDKEIVRKCSGDISINKIYFRYNENMPYVLENFSLHIRKGDYVAIVGETGCGKSTLVRLLLGFEKAERGSIFYDSKDIKSIDLRSLRRNMGTVTQGGGLFQGDIFSNIVITSPQLTLNDAWEAAEMAGIADDIREMPMGMNTVISEGQGGISGGQKQRLMIARAIVHKPKILIFDEATSALDNITQKKVSEALDKLDCTRIVIAHRLSTIRNCKRILFLNNGSIAEEGTYDELMAKNGLFAELVERQKI